MTPSYISGGSNTCVLDSSRRRRDRRGRRGRRGRRDRRGRRGRAAPECSRQWRHRMRLLRDVARLVPFSQSLDFKMALKDGWLDLVGESSAAISAIEPRHLTVKDLELRQLTRVQVHLRFLILVILSLLRASIVDRRSHPLNMTKVE
jgi:hypothetical protein